MAAFTTIAIGMAIGAAVGAVAGATVGGGGDAIWKGALVGAVSGAVTGGVGSWAGAGAGGWAGAAGGALAGGAGGITGGLLNAALNGGNSDSYLKGALFGGVGGAALGAAGGAFGGGGEGAVNGEFSTPQTTPLDMSTGTSVEGATVPLQETTSGLAGGNINGAAMVDPTLNASTPAVTTPALSDTNTFGTNQFAANNTGTMTDIGGSSATPQELPGGVPLDNSTPSLNDAFSNARSWNNSNAFSSVQPEGQTLAPLPETSMSPVSQAGNQSPTNWWDSMTSGASNTDTINKVNTGDESPYGKWWQRNVQASPNKGFSMDGDLGKYLKMQGYGQLASGLMKTAGAAATAPETRQNRQQLMDLYNTQMNQYNNQANAANQYQTQLQNTYSNPDEYLSSPEAVAARTQAMQKLLAQNAMAGRRTAGLAMQNQLMMNQLSNLANYRKGLQGNIQYPNYNGAANTLNYAQQYSPTADIVTGLNYGITPTSMYALADLFGK